MYDTLCIAGGRNGLTRVLKEGSLPTECMPAKSILTPKLPTRKEPVSHFLLQCIHPRNAAVVGMSGGQLI